MTGGLVGEIHSAVDALLATIGFVLIMSPVIGVFVVWMATRGGHK